MAAGAESAWLLPVGLRDKVIVNSQTLHHFTTLSSPLLVQRSLAVAFSESPLFVYRVFRASTAVLELKMGLP